MLSKCNAVRCCGSVTSLESASCKPARLILDDPTGPAARIRATIFIKVFKKRSGPRLGRQLVRIDVNNLPRWPAISGCRPGAARSASCSSEYLCICFVDLERALAGVRGPCKLENRNKRVCVAIYAMCLDACLTWSVTGRSPRLLRNQMMSHPRERPAETIWRVGGGRLDEGHWGTTHHVGGCAC